MTDPEKRHETDSRFTGWGSVHYPPRFPDGNRPPIPAVELALDAHKNQEATP